MGVVFLLVLVPSASVPVGLVFWVGFPAYFVQMFGHVFGEFNVGVGADHGSHPVIGGAPGVHDVGGVFSVGPFFCTDGEADTPPG